MFEVKNVYAGYSKGCDVVKNVSCSFPEGTVTAVIGANGCGKSTLLKVLARQLRTSRGAVFLEGKDIKEFPQKTLATRIAILPQVRNVPSISAKALVTHGRFPYMPFPRIPSSKDREIVKNCMSETDTLRFADTDVSTLSGGQRQRVYIAMLLAQQTDVILMDEPTTFLDMSCQFEVLDLIRSLRDKGKCIVVVLHDIAHAMQIADKIMLLDNGQNAFYGSPDELISSGALEKYMNIVPRRFTDGKESVYFFTKNNND